MDIAELHARTVGEWSRIVNQVDGSYWGSPTPCTEWTVRDLVNHVVGEDLWTVPLVQGQTIEQVGDRFDGDVLGDDPLATSNEATEQATRAVEERLPQGGTVHLSYGEERLEEYLHQLAADHLIHAWDLAVAIGTDTQLDHELVDAVAAWFADREELYRSFGVVGPKTAEGDDAQSRLIAAAGRDPQWKGEG